MSEQRGSSLGVVVGHDGSATAQRALEWAWSHAALYGLTVTVTHVWDVNPLTALSPAPPTKADLEAMRKAALTAGQDAVDRLPRHGRAPCVRVEAPRGRASEVLATAGHDADLVVVGRRGAGLAVRLLGSTSAAVLRSAPCPVAVVPEGTSTAAASKVVVGWDGSSAAALAVRWAADAAARSGGALEVVCAWQITSLHRDVVHELGVVPPLADYERAAARLASRGCEVAAAAGLSSDKLSARPVHSPATAALLNASREADLVVVGCRGLGGFTALVLGSTSEQLSRHATCPVVVVRTPADPTEPG